jgi:hypothetical protein
VKICQDRSGCQVSSGYLRLYLVKSGFFRLGHLISVQIRLGHEVMLDQDVSLAQVNSG